MYRFYSQLSNIIFTYKNTVESTPYFQHRYIQRKLEKWALHNNSVLHVKLAFCTFIHHLNFDFGSLRKP